MCVLAFLNWHHSMEEWATHLSSSAMQTWLNSNLRFALQNSRQIDFSFNISFVLDSQQGKTQLCLCDMSPLNPTWQLKSQGIMSNCFFFSIPAKPWLKNGGNNWGYHIMIFFVCVWNWNLARIFQLLICISNKVLICIFHLHPYPALIIFSSLWEGQVWPPWHCASEVCEVWEWRHTKICYGPVVTDTQPLAFMVHAAAYAQKHSKTYLYCETAIGYRFSQANFVEFSEKKWNKRKIIA